MKYLSNENIIGDKIYPENNEFHQKIFRTDNDKNGVEKQKLVNKMG